MKLKNKKTGEIMQLSVKCENGGELRTFDLNTNTDKPITLAELNAEWEDMPEEPKELYWVNYDGSISHAEEGTMSFVKQKQIGNYFDTREEAEQAVEKLKAWKRLKDCHIKFDLDFVMNEIKFTYRIGGGTLQSVLGKEEIIFEDLKMIFGGEE